MYFLHCRFETWFTMVKYLCSLFSTKQKETVKCLIIPPILKKNKEKSSDIWKGINSHVNIKSSKTSIIKLLDESNNLISDPRRISHKFNNYFSTIGPDIDRKILTIQGNFKNYFNKNDSNGKVIIGT